MKTKTIVALIATAIVSVGAYFYFTRLKIEPPIPRPAKQSIIGDWKIDSVSNTSDSNSVANLFSMLSDSISFKFNADSTLQIISPTKTETEHYVFTNDSLIIGRANYLDTFVIKFNSDSLLQAIAKDNSSLILRRK